jgi:hypothetical protein
MGLFGNDIPKRVTKEEWERITESVYGDLDERERNELEKFFRADLYEPGVEYGITEAEFRAGMEWLRHNMKKHEFEEADLDLLEKQFTEHLKD